MKTLTVILLLLLSFRASGQLLRDSFESPSSFLKSHWFGDRASFEQKDGRLHSINSNSYTEFSVHAPFAVNDSIIESRFLIELDFNTSSANYVEIGWYRDISFSNGILVRFGGTKDIIEVLEVTDGMENHLMISNEKITEKSIHDCKVVLTKDRILWRSTSSSGDFTDSAEISIGSADLSFFIINVRQSTQSFFGKHYLDNVYVGPIIRDVTPPSLARYEVIGSDKIELLFSEEIDTVSSDSIAIRIGNKTTYPNINWVSLRTCFVNPKLEIAESTDLILNQICDLDGNCFDTIATLVPYFDEGAAPYDIVISELMPDPEPTVGLEAEEYVELYNRSGKYIQLSSLSLSDHTATVQLPQYLFPPKTFILLVNKSATTSVGCSSPTFRIDLPSLNNASDMISVLGSDNILIHSVTYNESMYSSVEKMNGGWSLEMKDPEKFCTTSGNYLASVAVVGGTPGCPNSIADPITDNSPPRIIGFGVPDDSSVILYLDEKIHGEPYVDLIPLGPNCLDREIVETLSGSAEITLKLSPGFDSSCPKSRIDLFQLSDCYSNFADTSLVLQVPTSPAYKDLVLNEILYQAKNAAEFIEIKNVSQRAIDLSRIAIQTRGESSSWSTPIALSSTPVVIKPGERLCYSADRDKIISYFQSSATPEFINELTNFPNLSANGGWLGLCTKDLLKLDSTKYENEIHYPFLLDTRDVSIERIENSDFPQWISASTSSGYATPGSPNSYVLPNYESQGRNKKIKLHLTDDPISPNNDGFQDITGISFTTPNECSFKLVILDLNGNPVRTIISHGYNYGTSTISWDGSDDAGIILSSAIYLVYLMVWGEEIKTQESITPITLIR